MPADIEYRVEGLDELIARQKHLDNRIGLILRDFLEKSSKGFEAKAKYLAPVDTGRLRASINSRVDSRPVPMWAEAGTNLIYARPVEYGSQPHYAPISNLARWAKRHNISKGALWNSIWMWGTQPHPFFGPAFEWSKRDMEQFLKEAKDAIEEAWS